ncbi:nicotinate-nucleotide adenylyltransferase [Bacillus marinisedimentorum]|uniref:nicotinate-nucleotide adenylyltransferase n=1 Tax=Bacillus marinisedimentorum TaxID=1821260 RepID=UPI0008725749|nr:nicotinate-nucleotide adenylyltransferase [Bacillus marinisedimentorum]
MKNIGILGGTFDPPHYGHLLIAQEAYHQLSLDEVWFMPSNVPPHKEKESDSTAGDRLEMTRCAISGNDAFKLNDVELRRTGPSYTIDTIRLITDKEKDAVFYFIIGSDMVEYLPKWKNIDDLLRYVTFAGVKRPGYSLETEYPIAEVEVREFDVSSSFLRERIATGGNVRYYLPDEVRLYIEENGLYAKREST